MAGSLDLRKPADYKRQCCDPGEGWTHELGSLFRSEFCYLTFAKFLSLYLSVLICKMGIITWTTSWGWDEDQVSWRVQSVQHVAWYQVSAMSVLVRKIKWCKGYRVWSGVERPTVVAGGGNRKCPRTSRFYFPLSHSLNPLWSQFYTPLPPFLKGSSPEIGLSSLQLSLRNSTKYVLPSKLLPAIPSCAGRSGFSPHRIRECQPASTSRKQKSWTNSH